MNLIEAFEKNLLNLGQPQRTVDSTLSKIFFIDGKAYKVYKYEDNFAGKFSSLDFRKDIYVKEFECNSAASPDVYISLNALSLNNEKWIEVPVDEASDFYMVMNELSSDENIIELLYKDSLKESQIKEIALYVESIINDLEVSNRDFIDSYEGDPKDKLEGVLVTSFSDWAKTFSSPNVDNELVSKVTAWLKSFYDSSAYFQNYDKSRLTVGLDNHAGNMFLYHDKPQYIDIYPPVKEWLVLDKLLNVSLIASAFTVFLGKDKSKVFYTTSFGNQYKDLEKVIDFYEMRYCLAQGMYYEKLERPEIASKFFDFVRSKIDTKSIS